MTDKLDVCRFFPTLGGVTDWTYSINVMGYQSPALAGVVTGAPYSYRAESTDLTQWEIGTGIYDGTKFLRTTVLYNSSGTGTLQGGAGTKIIFNFAPQVAIIILASDVTPIITPECRPTLTSGVGVMQSSVAGATRVYLTTYGGNRIPVKYGTRVVSEVFAEVFQDTTDATKSPAAVAANKNYYMHFWNDNGVQRCTRGFPWTGDTNPGIGAGTAELVWDSTGLPWNKFDITNGPAAGKGLAVTMIRSNAASTIDYIFGTAASGGIAGVFNVFSFFNRVDVGCLVLDTGTAYTLVGSTIRQVRNSSGMQVSFILGVAEDAVIASYAAQVQTAAAVGATASWGLGFDKITTPYDQRATFVNQNGTATWGSAIPAVAVWNPGIGAHYVAALEASDGGGNANNLNIAGAATINGLSFRLRM